MAFYQVRRDQEATVSIVSHNFKKGIAAFNAGEYQRSIKHFDKAIESIEGDDNSNLKVNIFDSRAAAKHKLNDIKGALDDAQKTIHHAPQSPKVSCLFYQINKLKASIQMFKMAIKYSRSGSPAMDRSLTNFFGSLPAEIFIQIVSLLDNGSRFKCLRICSLWRQMILNTPSLWKSITLSSSFNRSPAKLEFWLERLGLNHCLEHVKIEYSATWKLETLEHIINELISLSSDQKSPRMKLKSFSFYSNCPLNCSDSVIGLICLNRFSLVDLYIKTHQISFPVTLEVFLKLFPRLRTLKLESGNKLSTNSQNFTTLSSLVKNLTGNAESSSPDKFSLKIPTLPPLEELGLINVKFEQPVESESYLLKLAHLISVTFISQNGTEQDYISMVDFLDLPKLSSLHLSGPSFRLPLVSAPMMFGYPCLQSIRLSECTQVLETVVNSFRELPEGASFSTQGNQVTFLSSIHQFAPKLKLISLDQIDPIVSYSFLEGFASAFHQLESLSLEGVTISPQTSSMLICALKILPPLIDLNLNDARPRSEVLEAVKLGRLKTLQIRNAVEVTFRSLTRLVQPRICYLEITGCRLISSRDMIEWLGRHVDVLSWQDESNKRERAMKKLIL
ncbi:hypothetical protein BY996DRAFT_4584546 [Phakopsora pachyrhizi]|uniref:Expressed protein n=1 Tax=Phakopsora pachyrhizi TaxID=170000 RepID=A0AAV0B5C8_PHAPC|nr:hypothetical protein BY996DRAFT_4584546 [Phakopsora pachyrhizi]CAH7682039.1 expressed protein [Phakopsora pachyrhizi]